MLAESFRLDSSGTGDPFEQQTVLLPSKRRDASPGPSPFKTKTGALTGSTIGQYDVKELIGRGSFGEVYRAVDPRLGRDVAVKVAERGIAEDPDLRKLFWNEARIQARLEHANIVPIYDIVEEPGRLFMVMRLIHGDDLDKRLELMLRPFTPSEALPVMRQISSALGSAHDKGVIHQDLKPGNIRLTPRGEAIVLDFGVARITGQAEQIAGRAGGTPGYMSPEQIRGEPMDARSDIYALAMTLYKTLTGHHPFENAGDLEELLEWQVDRPPPPPTEFNESLPGALVEAILQGLAKNPRERFRACADFVRAVSRALGAEDAEPTSDADGRWNPRAQVNLGAQVTLPSGESFYAQVVDLSITGAALRLPRSLPIGTRTAITIRIPLKTSEHFVRCMVKVLRARPDIESKAMLTGVAFEELGQFDQLVLGDLVRAVLLYRAS